MGRRTSSACAEETVFPQNVPQTSSTRASLGRLLGTAWVLPGKNRKIRGKTEGRSNPEVTRSSGTRGAGGVSVPRAVVGEISQLSACSYPAEPRGCALGWGCCRGKGRGHTRAWPHLHTSLNTHGKLHLGNPSEVIHTHNFSLGISHRANIDLSVPQWL